jgi:hypothetical protein
MKLDKEHLKIAEVHWVDSLAGSSWTLTEDYEGDNAIDCFTIGILINESESAVTLAQNVGFSPDQFCNTITIPKCAVKSIETRVYNVKGKAYYV